MSFASFGTGGASVDYITREKAAAKISFVKLPELRADTTQEQRQNAIAYAELRTEVEKSKRRDARTNYKLLLSWDRKETSETADRMATEFVEKNFPTAKAIVAIHQDTEHTHAHIWIDARGTDEKKLHFKKNEWRTVDERWHRAFDDEYGTDYFSELKAKKLETAAYKKARAQGFEAVKPARAEDNFNHRHWRAKEIENLSGECLPIAERTLIEGKLSDAVEQTALASPARKIIRKSKDNEKIGFGNDQRTAATENDGLGTTEPAIAATERPIGTAKRSAEDIIERFERERRFAKTVIEPLRSAAADYRQTIERDESGDQSTGTREPLDHREHRAFEIGKTAVRGRGDDEISDDRLSIGDQSGGGNVPPARSRAIEESGGNQNDQPPLALDGATVEDGRRGIEQNQTKCLAGNDKHYGLLYADVLDSQSPDIVASQPKNQEIFNAELYQSGFGENSGTGKSDATSSERMRGENDRPEVFDQLIANIANEDQTEARRRFEDDFDRTEVITVYSQQSGTMITEIVAANEAALRTSELLIGQPLIAPNGNAALTPANPFVGSSGENATVFQSAAPGQTPAANFSEIQQAVSAALETLAATSAISYEVTEINRLSADTESLLAGSLTTGGGELGLPDFATEETFEISDEIQLNAPPRQQTSPSYQYEPEEMDDDHERDDAEMEFRESFGGFSL